MCISKVLCSDALFFPSDHAHAGTQVSKLHHDKSEWTFSGTFNIGVTSLPFILYGSRNSCPGLYVSDIRTLRSVQDACHIVLSCLFDVDGIRKLVSKPLYLPCTRARSRNTPGGCMMLLPRQLDRNWAEGEGRKHRAAARCVAAPLPELFPFLLIIVQGDVVGKQLRTKQDDN